MCVEVNVRSHHIGWRFGKYTTAEQLILWKSLWSSSSMLCSLTSCTFETAVERWRWLQNKDSMNAEHTVYVPPYRVFGCRTIHVEGRGPSHPRGMMGGRHWPSHANPRQGQGSRGGSTVWRLRPLRCASPATRTRRCGRCSSAPWELLSPGRPNEKDMI